MCYNILKMGGTDQDKGEVRGGWVRNRLLPILGLLLIIGIVVGVFFFYRSYPERVEALEGYGYLGVFFISVLLNATIVLPAGNFLVLATMGAILPSATLVGLAGGIGAAIGELTGYAAGYSGQARVSRQRVYTRLKGWVERWGMLTIFILSVVPLVFDLAGIAAGVIRFPLWKFFIACWLGRTILYLVIAWGGAMGWEALLNWLG
jgi:membrane protein YqaA with SNARE-associated domain